MASSNKGGYDCEFVSTPAKSLECSICLLVLRNPHVIGCCGNHFCEPCIGRVQRDKKPCPLCNSPDFSSMLHKGVMREVKSLEVYCPQKSLGCIWKGELGKIDCHENVGSRDSGCGYLAMDCTYQCGDRFLRKDLKRHEEEDCPERPVDSQIGQLAAQMREVLSESRKVKTELKQQCKNLEKKCERMEERNRDLESRNVSLEGTLQEMSAKVGAIEAIFEESMQEMKAKLDTSKSERNVLKNRVSMLESLAQKVFQVESRLKRESQRLDEVEQTVKKDRTDLEYQSTAIETCLTPTPPFYFTLCNFEYYKSIDFHWQSDPFYSFPRGYKLSVTVYPNGTSKGKGTYLSVYVAILRGEYDDELEWPFKGVVNVQLYNYGAFAWESKPPIEFEDSDGVKFTGKPQDTLSNMALGIPRWVLLEDITYKYCHKGMIRFKVPKVDVFSYSYVDVQ